MMNFKILSVVLVVIYFANSQENNYLVIKNISRFPIQLGRPFEMTISAIGEFKLSNSQFDTMVIQVTDPTGSDKEIAIFEFGMKENNDQDFNGVYLRIAVWEKNEEKRIIFSVINFTKLAHDKILEIYILNPTSMKEQKKMLSDLKRVKNIYKSQISLLIPPEIELKVNEKSDDEIVVNKDSVVEATCRAFNGLQKFKPMFANYWAFSVLSNFTIVNLNTLQIKFKVSLADHGKNLTCQVGNKTRIVKINVFHSPTNVVFQPEVNTTIGNNTGIICTAFNGYPIPRIMWQYIKGPPNSSAYYQIGRYNQRLFIKHNAPIGSSWEFMCSASNSFLETFNKTISFRIINQKRNLTESKYNFYYNNTLDKAIYRDNLTRYEEINKKLKDFNINIHSNALKISMLKDASYAQRLQIFELKQTIRKMEEKQQKTNQEIISIKKIVNSEIKNLKNEIDKLKDILSNKNERSSLEKPKSIFQNRIIMPIATFDWKIYRISRLRRKGKYLPSSKFGNNNIRFSMMLFLKFNDFEYLQITVYMSPINDADSLLLIKGYVTITLINSMNLQLQKSLKLDFQRGRQAANIDFNFKYIDLYQNGILQTDNIIVRCSLTIL